MGTQRNVATVVPQGENVMTTKKKSVRKSRAKKSSNGAAKRPVAVLKKTEGVIATIVKTISRDQGASKNEILTILTKAFPDRLPEQMRATVGVQLSRHSTSKKDDEKRGRVYFRRGRK